MRSPECETYSLIATSHAIVDHTVRTDLPELAAAVRTLLEGLPPNDAAGKRELLDRVLDEELPRQSEALRRLGE